MTFLRKIALCSTITALGVVSMPKAQAQISDQPEELNAIYACKAKINPDERLACYDAAVGRFETAQKSGEVVTVSKKEIEKVERDAFGFNIPSLPSLGNLFGGGDNKPTKIKKTKNALTDPVEKTSSEEAERKLIPSTSIPSPAETIQPKVSKITQITLDIRKTTEFGYEKTRFFMANGQVWEQTDGRKVRVPKARNGQKNTAEISKAIMGSFMLRVNGKGTAVKVRRVR